MGGFIVKLPSLVVARDVQSNLTDHRHEVPRWWRVMLQKELHAHLLITVPKQLAPLIPLLQ